MTPVLADAFCWPPVEFVERTPGHGFAGEEVGKCLAPIPGEISARELVVALVGYWSEETPDWPPSYAEARTESRDALARSPAFSP